MGWRDLASADDLWFPLAQSRWPGTRALHREGFITGGFQSTYSRRSRLERTERVFSSVVESKPPEVVASDFSVLVELVCDGMPIISQLFGISTVSATSVDVVLPDDARWQVLDPSWENAALDVSIVRRRDRMYKRLLRQPAIELIGSEDFLYFDVEAVWVVPKRTLVKVEHLDDYRDGGPLMTPCFQYNCSIRGARTDDMTKRLEIELWSSLDEDMVPGTHVLRSFELLGEWI